MFLFFFLTASKAQRSLKKQWCSWLQTEQKVKKTRSLLYIFMAMCGLVQPSIALSYLLWSWMAFSWSCSRQTWRFKWPLSGTIWSWITLQFAVLWPFMAFSCVRSSIQIHLVLFTWHQSIKELFDIKEIMCPQCYPVTSRQEPSWFSDSWCLTNLPLWRQFRETEVACGFLSGPLSIRIKKYFQVTV